MNSKEFFFNEVLKKVAKPIGEPLRVLELGCGTAVYVPHLITAYPKLEYVGVEPNKESFDTATKILTGVPRTKIFFQLGYDAIDGIEDASFDVVISFSVLEHVKNLDAFMKLGARYLKSGGLMVNRYDLGHALHSNTLKERFHVFLGNNFPSILPETRFVRYVPMHEVEMLHEKHLGQLPDTYTYHQMPNHKRLEKELASAKLPTKVSEDMYQWEFTHKETFAALPLEPREKLFPTIAVWGKKK